MDLFKVLSSAYVFIEEIGTILKEAVSSFAESLNEWKEQEKVRITEMVKIGWYPNWATFSYTPEDVGINETYDEFMIRKIDTYFDEITNEILLLCPNRSEILNAAFNLHKQENYIASIPLFIIQADGICDDEQHGYFFTANRGEKKAAGKITDSFENNDLKFEFFTSIALELFETHKGSQISAPIKSNTHDQKKNGPNRSGILHGDKDHLDYGSKLNSYKAVSFLAFIVFTTKYLLKKEGQLN